MNLKDKKFIPYYLFAASIILIAIIAVTVITNINRKNKETYEPEIITETDVYDFFIANNIPYYENVPVSTLNSDLFIYDDTGRMTYNDENVRYSTGIDVSSHQGDIDWDEVASDGIDFAILRAGYRGYGTSGIMGEDSMFRENARKALDAGLDIGVYFYSQAITVEEAIEEADYLLEIIKDFEIRCPVVFDWENDPEIGMRTDNLSSNIITDCAVAFCEKIRSVGYTPAVYFNLTDAYERYDLDRIDDYIFWYAQYKGTYPLFYYRYSLWQYTSTGSVKGIDGSVDINICFEDFQ